MCDILKHTTMKTGDKVMKKIHRTLSLFTVAAMCAALLCSCGEVPDSSQTDSSSKAATTTTADTTADTTTTGEASSTASATSAPDSSVSDSSSAVTDDTKTNGITPAMWKVTSPEGNTMVMLGSFHALKDECYPLPEAVTNAYNNADILAVECDITSTSEDGEYMKNLMKQMLYNDNTKLSQHISEEAYSALQTYLGYWGMDISALEVYRPWAISSTLDTLLIQDADFDSEKGLDNYLLTTAHADGKEIYEVESVDFQMNLLINFSDDIYDLMFRSYEGETKESQKQALEDLYTAWKSGDIETFLEEDNEEELAGYTEEDKKIAEDYNNQMLYDRNKNMAKAAEAYHHPHKLPQNYDYKIVVEDKANVLGNTAELRNSLVAFYNRTGISPAVITVENSDWQGVYSDLENYAYDLYVNHFADESHWLIVYSTPDGYSSSDGFEDWYWEGMQGNDTDDVLTKSVTNSFNDELQKNLTARTRYTVSSAISTSFDDLTPTVMKSKVNWTMLFTSIAILAFVCLHACLMIGINPKARKYAKAKPCSDAAQEKACEYCGYTYVVDTCTECPHCGAPIPPEDQPGHDLLDKKVTA